MSNSEILTTNSVASARLRWSWWLKAHIVCGFSHPSSESRRCNGLSADFRVWKRDRLFFTVQLFDRKYYFHYKTNDTRLDSYQSTFLAKPNLLWFRFHIPISSTLLELNISSRTWQNVSLELKCIWVQIQAVQIKINKDFNI